MHHLTKTSTLVALSILAWIAAIAATVFAPAWSTLVVGAAVTLTVLVGTRVIVTGAVNSSVTWSHGYHVGRATGHAEREEVAA